MTANNMNRRQNSKHGDPELAKTVHWRRVKNIAYSVLDIAEVDPSVYDLNNICCYNCYGADLQGKNVDYIPNGKQNSCWVDDNAYTVFEIPTKDSHNLPEGNFLVLAQNTSFDYWIAAGMFYSINNKESLRYNKLMDTVRFYPWGQFTATPKYGGNNASMVVTCKASSSELKFDMRSPRFDDFDHQGCRKKAYHTSEGGIMTRLRNGQSYTQKHTAGGSRVKKYNHPQDGKSKRGTGK